MICSMESGGMGELYSLTASIQCHASFVPSTPILVTCMLTPASRQAFSSLEIKDVWAIIRLVACYSVLSNPSRKQTDIAPLEPAVLLLCKFRL